MSDPLWERLVVAAIGRPSRERRDAASLRRRREFGDEAYDAARSSGEVIEQRLKIYFAAPESSDIWHRVTELLAMRARIRWINAGVATPA